MIALRQILDVTNQSLRIDLPEGFPASRVEVIVLPIDEPVEKDSKNSNADLRGKLKLSENQYNDFHSYIKQSREEWDS